MKNTLLLVASFGLLVSQGFGYNTVTTNIAAADATAVPILDNTGPVNAGSPPHWKEGLELPSSTCYKLD